MTSFSQMQSQLQSQMQLQGLALPPEPKVGPSATRVSTKWSYVDPSPTDPETGDLDKCGLYIEENPSHLVSLGRVYEGSTAVHNIPFLHRQVRVSVEEVKDAKAPVPVPTDKAVVSPAKPPDRAHPEVDDPLYLMTLTIPHLFLRPLQVMWDATVFGVFNQDFPLYIKHADLSEITHDGQCLSISILQLWIIQVCEQGISMCMDSSSHSPLRDLGNRSLNRKVTSRVGCKVQNAMSTLDPTCNGSDNYLKGIINSALKGLDDTPQPKSKAGARWIVVKYFNDVRPLETERLKALRIQWAQFYLKVTNQS
ncbi:hypothetical protein HKD37_08G023108 [Glycine soja]